MSKTRYFGSLTLTKRFPRAWDRGVQLQLVAEAVDFKSSASTEPADRVKRAIGLTVKQAKQKTLDDLAIVLRGPARTSHTSARTASHINSVIDLVYSMLYEYRPWDMDECAECPVGRLFYVRAQALDPPSPRQRVPRSGLANV